RYAGRTLATESRTNRRTEIADAAIAVLAEEGSRGLTHRAVDRHLGIAEGSTSRYYSTRRALLGAAMARMVEAHLEDTAPVDASDLSEEEAAHHIAAIFEEVSDYRTERRAARYELMLEASRDEELRDEVRSVRDEHLRQSVRMLRQAGAEDPELGGRALAVFF